VNNARVAGQETLKGRIAPGYLADLAVLDRDPFQLPPEALKDVAVRLTLVDGRVVYRAGSEGAATEDQAPGAVP
jgi:predicted amidohydrolase YtcJ